MSNAPTFSIETLGCKVNQVDSEKLADDLMKSGYQPHAFAAGSKKVDLAIINTCTVTKRADSKSLQAIKKATRQAREVYVTGCYSELEKGLLKKLPGIAGIISHTEKTKAVQIITERLSGPAKRYGKETPGQYGKMHKIATAHLNSQQAQFHFHTRAFVKISDGCNSFCSFCRIPFARGVQVSRDRHDILNQVRKLVDAMAPEIVLTGVNLGEYKDGRVGFTELVLSILKIVEGSKTLVRISTIEPHSLSIDLVESLSHPNVSPHLHLALQGGVDRILRLMRRRYTTEQYLHILHTLRKANPHFAFSSDVITGFPGETEEEFMRGRVFIENCQFMKLHVFPYSPRPLTKAAHFSEQVSAKEKKRRVRLLTALSDTLAKRYKKKLVGHLQRFILEKECPLEMIQQAKGVSLISQAGPYEGKEKYFLGTSEYYLKGIVAVKQNCLKGQLIQARLIDEDRNIFSSEP